MLRTKGVPIDNQEEENIYQPFTTNQSFRPAEENNTDSKQNNPLTLIDFSFRKNLKNELSPLKNESSFENNIYSKNDKNIIQSGHFGNNMNNTKINHKKEFMKPDNNYLVKELFKENKSSTNNKSKKNLKQNQQRKQHNKIEKSKSIDEDTKKKFLTNSININLNKTLSNNNFNGGIINKSTIYRNKKNMQINKKNIFKTEYQNNFIDNQKIQIIIHENTKFNNTKEKTMKKKNNNYNSNITKKTINKIVNAKKSYDLNEKKEHIKISLDNKENNMNINNINKSTFIYNKSRCESFNHFSNHKITKPLKEKNNNSNSINNNKSFYNNEKIKIINIYQKTLNLPFKYQNYCNKKIKELKINETFFINANNNNMINENNLFNNINKKKEMEEISIKTYRNKNNINNLIGGKCKIKHQFSEQKNLSTNKVDIQD